MSETTARTRLNLFARCEVVQSDSPLFSSDKRSSISADLPRDEIARAFWGSAEFTPGGLPVTWTKLTDAERVMAVKRWEHEQEKAKAAREQEAPRALPAAPPQEYVTRKYFDSVMKGVAEGLGELIREHVAKQIAEVEKKAVFLVLAIDSLMSAAELLEAEAGAASTSTASQSGALHDGGIYESGKSYKKGPSSRAAGARLSRAATPARRLVERRRRRTGGLW